MPIPPTVPWRGVASTAKRLVVITAGFTLCGAGLILLVLPGPGILVVFAGLVVLATEYSWAERALERTRARAVDATSRLQASRIARTGVAMSATALITGSAAVAVIVDGHRYLALSGLVAGLAALAILIPATQRLIDRPPRSSTAAPTTTQVTRPDSPRT